MDKTKLTEYLEWHLRQERIIKETLLSTTNNQEGSIKMMRELNWHKESIKWLGVLCL